MKHKYFPHKIIKSFIPNNSDILEVYDGIPFTGIKIEENEDSIVKSTYVNGVFHGTRVAYYKFDNSTNIYVYQYGIMRLQFINYVNSNNNIVTQITFKYDSLTLDDIYSQDGQWTRNTFCRFMKNDLDYERIMLDNQDIVKYYEENKHLTCDFDSFCNSIEQIINGTSEVENLIRIKKVFLSCLMRNDMIQGRYDLKEDLVDLFALENQLKNQIIRFDKFSGEINHIGGICLSYNEFSRKIVVAIVVLNTEDLEIVDFKSQDFEIDYPYVSELYSHIEANLIVEVFKKLSIIPNLIVYDGHGLSHPYGIGTATILGMKLDIATIGTSSKRLIGEYNEKLLTNKRGGTVDLIWNNSVVGKVLCTHGNNAPIFVSIGHKTGIETAMFWALELTKEHRLPKTTIILREFINKTLHDITQFDYYGDETKC